MLPTWWFIDLQSWWWDWWRHLPWKQFSVVVERVDSGRHRLRPPQEPKVARPGVHLSGVAGDEARAEVVGVVRLITIDGEVAAGVVRRLHPDLAQVRVAALALCLRVGNDHLRDDKFIILCDTI
jgi:hypothetical protein